MGGNRRRRVQGRTPNNGRKNPTSDNPSNPSKPQNSGNVDPTANEAIPSTNHSSSNSGSPPRLGTNAPNKNSKGTPSRNKNKGDPAASKASPNKFTNGEASKAGEVVVAPTDQAASQQDRTTEPIETSQGKFQRTETEEETQILMKEDTATSPLLVQTHSGEKETIAKKPLHSGVQEQVAKDFEDESGDTISPRDSEEESSNLLMKNENMVDNGNYVAEDEKKCEGEMASLSTVRSLRRASQGDVETNAPKRLEEVNPEQTSLTRMPSGENESDALDQFDGPSCSVVAHKQHMVRQESNGELEITVPDRLDDAAVALATNKEGGMRRASHGEMKINVPDRQLGTKVKQRNMRRASKGEIEVSTPQRKSESPTVFSQSPNQELHVIHEALPVVPSLSGGLRRKAGLCDLDAWVKLSLTLDGRDKITKIMQYSARLLAWWYLGSSKHHAKRFDNLKKSLSSSRKAFRLGRTLVELQRLKSMGLLETLAWHWKRTACGDTSEEDSVESKHPKALLRRVSTNIGLTYSNRAEMTDSFVKQHPYLLRSLSRIPSRLFQITFGFDTEDSEKPFSHILFSAVKLIGLAIYFGGDNISYLASIGLCDNFQITDESKRISNRKELSAKAATYGNRAYFIACLAGLVVSWRNYREFCAKTNKQLEEEDGGSECDHDKAKEKQFSLFLSFMKSCCDVLVFSNNPGINLWRNVLGYPLHEAVHCTAGLVSASTVLCNIYPDG